MEVEDHVDTSDDDEAEPVGTSLQVETPSTSDSCTSSSTPSFSTTHTQSPFVTVSDLSKKGEKPRQPPSIYQAGRHFGAHWYSQFSWIEYSK